MVHVQIDKERITRPFRYAWPLLLCGSIIIKTYGSVLDGSNPIVDAQRRLTILLCKIARPLSFAPRSPLSEAMVYFCMRYILTSKSIIRACFLITSSFPVYYV